MALLAKLIQFIKWIPVGIRYLAQFFPVLSLTTKTWNLDSSTYAAKVFKIYAYKYFNLKNKKENKKHL